jgi:hypothetical protein
MLYLAATRTGKAAINPWPDRQFYLVGLLDRTWEGKRSDDDGGESTNLQLSFVAHDNLLAVKWAAVNRLNS